MKKRFFSAYNDFKTGLLFKLTLILGLLLLSIWIFTETITFFTVKKSGNFFFEAMHSFSGSQASEASIAFSILLIGVSIILYFFHYQFAKLAMIAEEVENDEELKSFESE